MTNFRAYSGLRDRCNADLQITSYGFPAFPIAEAYYNRLKQLPHWEECNAKGIEGFKQFAAGKLQ